MSGAWSALYGAAQFVCGAWFGWHVKAYVTKRKARK